MKINVKSTLIWLLPLIISLLFQGLSFDWNRVVFGNAIENLFTLIILISVILLFNQKLGAILQYILFMCWTLSCLFETIYYYLFKANLSASSVYIMLETNFAESKEFIEFYMNPAILLFIVVYLILIAIFFIKRLHFKSSVYGFKRKMFLLSTFIFSVFILIQIGYIKYNFAFLTLKTIKEYVFEYKRLKSYHINKSISDIKDFSYGNNIKKATYVLILGESSTKNRFSLYGYSRNTTPYLKSIENDLIVYNNVISSNAFTIGSLRKMLTLNGLTEKDEFSIIQLMNQAGFKTFWLSNQRPIGEYESLVTKIASASDYFQTKNTAIDGSITPYDEVLIPLFEKALKDKAALKFIVLHPLGTHMNYSDRYPESFNKFIDKSPSNFDYPNAHRLSNAYDNAILYHDNLIKKIHKKLRLLKEPSYMFYLSDHGEEVFDDIDFAGHMDDNPTKSMYEIPFFLWMNSKFKNLNSIDIDTKRPYSVKDFMHSFSDLNNIQFEKYNSKKSIFSEDFEPSKRIIGNGIDFDMYFEKQNDNIN